MGKLKVALIWVGVGLVVLVSLSQCGIRIMTVGWSMAVDYVEVYKAKLDSERMNERMATELDNQKLKLANQNRLVLGLLQELMPLIPKENDVKKQQVLMKYGVGESK